MPLPLPLPFPLTPSPSAEAGPFSKLAMGGAEVEVDAGAATATEMDEWSWPLELELEALLLLMLGWAASGLLRRRGSSADASMIETKEARLPKPARLSCCPKSLNASASALSPRPCRSQKHTPCWVEP